MRIFGRIMEDVSRYMFRSSKTGHSNPIRDYVIGNSLRENVILKRLREKTQEEFEKHSMLCAPEEAQLFTLLLKLMNAKKAIEIGVFTGYNLLNVAMALPKDGKIIGCDISSEYVNFGKPFFDEAGVKDKIDIRIQPALQTLDELIKEGEGGTFDFIFIDADNIGYDSYYEKSLHLLRTGGLIALDNVLQMGRVTYSPDKHDDSAKATDKLNKKIHKDSRVDISMLPISDGVLLCRKL